MSFKDLASQTIKKVCLMILTFKPLCLTILQTLKTCYISMVPGNNSWHIEVFSVSWKFKKDINPNVIKSSSTKVIPAAILEESMLIYLPFLTNSITNYFINKSLLMNQRYIYYRFLRGSYINNYSENQMENTLLTNFHKKSFIADASLGSK